MMYGLKTPSARLPRAGGAWKLLLSAAVWVTANEARVRACECRAADYRSKTWCGRRDLNPHGPFNLEVAVKPACSGSLSCLSCFSWAA